MSGSAFGTNGFIAVDWGTTNRRAYLVEDGRRCTSEFEDGRGILSVEAGQFKAAVDEIRDRLGDRPMLLAGMVGSNRGWTEAPYVPCPAGLDELARRLAWVEDGRTAIVPGVAYVDDRCDVMRGEEVQLLGAAAGGEIPPDCIVCHPGTHNKWVRMSGGRIESFRTVMTGELFNLLKERSILSELLAGSAVTDFGLLRGRRARAFGRRDHRRTLRGESAILCLGGSTRKTARRSSAACSSARTCAAPASSSTARRSSSWADRS